MDIQTCGGETALLGRLLAGAPSAAEVVVPNGDDASVVRIGGELLAVTTDTVVEGRHFDRRFSSLHDVGWKAVEAAASDVVAMGGYPRHLYLAVTVPRETPLEDMEEMYRGIRASAARIGAVILGGDTTLGTKELILTVTVVGSVRSEGDLTTRSGARVGDLLCVSGPLGGAAAGLTALSRGVAGFETVSSRHRTPRCRIDCVAAIAPLASSMIDVSDGLSSEVHHLCRMSACGAVLYAAQVPFDAETMAAGREFGVDPLEWALAGGDDYELLYTVAPSDRAGVVGVVIGEMTADRRVLLDRDGTVAELVNAGYDHLR